MKVRMCKREKESAVLTVLYKLLMPYGQCRHFYVILRSCQIMSSMVEEVKLFVCMSFRWHCFVCHRKSKVERDIGNL